MKITALEVENVKRIKAVRLEPSENGLTVIGGRNGQGKTSVLSAIAYAFGGEKYRPTNLRREEAVGEAKIHIETDDGFVIERKGPKAALTVTDPSGRKGGQKILDELVGKMAIDLPAFLSARDAEKADILLGILGIGDAIVKSERKEQEIYNRRLLVGREADRKTKAAEEMPTFADAPDEPVSITELIAEQQAVLARNGENEKLRNAAARARQQKADAEARVAMKRRELADAERSLKEAEEAAGEAAQDADGLTDGDTAELEERIADFEEVNRKVAANKAYEAVKADADALQETYRAMSDEIQTLRDERAKLLEGAKLPYPGLSVADGRLCLNGVAWDCMSGAMQLIVGTSIARAVNPKCGFVLLDKLEQLDAETLAEFGGWLEANGLQAIATRVSTGGECTLIIEDGEVAGAAPASSTGNGNGINEDY